MRGLVVALLLLLTSGLVSSRAEEEACRTPHLSSPRTLVLALDGIPHRVVVEARERGAFSDWTEPRRMISPFPSVTNVSFTVMLETFGVEPARGYEFRHFDRENNHMSRVSPFTYRKQSFAWREMFDSMGRSIGSKIAVYTIPWRKSKKELASAETALLELPHELILAHVGSTDALQHLRGDKQTTKMVLELDEWLVGLRERHLEETGRELRVVLLSDHGNTDGKVRGMKGVQKRLERAGLRVRKKLSEPGDVVAEPFGLVSYGALYLDPSRAECAATALVGHPTIELAAWLSGPDEIQVMSTDGRARIVWRGDDGAREFAYRPLAGDPLMLGDTVARLNAAGRLDREGFAPDAVWFRESALSLYPDAMHRLRDSLVGDHLVNHATLLFSVAEGYSWGQKSARWGSWLRGGRIEGTHGGLDAESTNGFLMSTDPSLDSGFAVRAENALADLAQERLRDMACSEERGAGAGGLTAD